MLAARIAALGLISCSLQLCAQQAQGHLTIRVTDVIGAVIPGARVEIDHALGAPDSFQLTDGRGDLVCDLTPGQHKVSVRVDGFENWAGEIDMQSATGQHLAVTMKIGSYSGPWGGFADYTDYDSLRGRPPEEPILLPAFPFATLPLTPKPAGKHEKWAKL